MSYTKIGMDHGPYREPAVRDEYPGDEDAWFFAMMNAILESQCT